MWVPRTRSLASPDNACLAASVGDIRYRIRRRFSRQAVVAPDEVGFTPVGDRRVEGADDQQLAPGRGRPGSPSLTSVTYRW